MSASTKFTVRAATREDGPFLAWVLLQAGRSQHPRGLFERVLGSKYTEEQLLTILTDFILDESPEGTGSFTHWGGWFVAQTEDGTRAGGLTGYAYKEKPMTNFSALLATVLATKYGWVEEDFAGLTEGMATMTTCMVTLAQSDEFWVVEFVATKPEFRRQGVNNLLMQAALSKGRQLGYTKAQISVFSDNIAAIKAYEKVGFGEYNTVTSPAFLQVVNSPGVMNMRTALE
ncbi:acetyltransferase, GNAT superfamily protein [Acanthamoeba castellanii str. Neff]|uniref:Acetyltransferase, GNAT superfamily protein n=1 Tax=Acanthamoeba castellanii (strain ATCC 30010 / Neff) TaxID=1257118 RepID=L8H9V2_ACACF|nr:acetyltransferase, GNAT superfamily protein [Acanthamoeba castellanii str. Neff]ELR22017.1 acetyltransferase, GNAT superfamily protein [Acanthamoeba castellanii str. Neff]